MPIVIRQNGDLSKIEMYLNKLTRKNYVNILHQYANKGIEALKQYTPKDTGLTAASWYYEIERSSGRTSIVFRNSNVNKHVNIAMIIQEGHATGTGGWVEGVDYINPALGPIFEQIKNELLKEV